jgi:hypothetical protein
MEVEERVGYYDLVEYQHIIIDDEEFIFNKETLEYFRVIPDINHGCKEEIEFKTTNDEISEVFGISEKLTLNEFLELGGKL